MTTFKDLGLNSEIIKSLDDLGFENPSPIQEKSIPFLLKSKKDLIALAQTGTGKTAAFSLPILNQIDGHKKDLQAIIICPTRELCMQISRDIKKLAKYSKGIAVTPVYGGERIDLQIKSLKKGANIVVGTPGRVHDLIRRKILKLQSIKWLVLDEADEMLDMGFKDDLDAILSQTPQTRQTLLFSATMSDSVRSIAKQYMTDTREIGVGGKNIGAEKVAHEYYLVKHRDRFEALKRILDYLPGVYGIIFCRTKNETQEIADQLKRFQYDAEAIHGDVSQNMRTKIMDRFKQKKIRLLVATDVAARGIDVNDLSHVINYNLPDKNESYTHRSGRTGRAQKSGVCISMISPKETRRIKALERILNKKFEHKKVPTAEDIYRKQVYGFVEDIKSTDIKKISDKSFLDEATEKLKKISKEDLIKSFIIHKFGHPDNKKTGDLNVEVKSLGKDVEDGVNLQINFGKKHGLDIKGLFALVNAHKKLKGIEIGKIDLMSDCAIFAIEKKRADEVVGILQGVKFRGRKVNIKKSNQGSNFSGKRRSGKFKRDFKGKRRRPGGRR